MTSLSKETTKKDVDGRNKSGHDDVGAYTRSTRSIISSRGTAMGLLLPTRTLRLVAFERVALGDAVDLLHYRAGVGVDVEGEVY
jgi:hypothetical protein